MKTEGQHTDHSGLGDRLTGPAARRVAILLIFVLLLDQISKQFVLNWIFAAPRIYPIMPFLNFVPVWNPGISFGMLADGGQVVSGGVTLLAFAVVGWFFWQVNRLNHVQQIAAGLISGGAAGNAIDRLRFGKVVDFIDIHVQSWHWPAFNVADAAITVGATFWVYSIFFVQETDQE